MTPETALKNQCKDYLALKGIFNFPILQGLGAFKGIPDRIAIHKSIPYAIEFKTKKGRQSEDQIKFQQSWELAGGKYLLIRDLDELMKVF